MAKYQNAYRNEAEDETSYSEELATTAPANDNAEPKDADEASFKKRYGDLRRHTQQQQANFEAELKAMKEQLDAATKSQIKFPKTDEEIEAWSAKYPDVAKIVDTIARKRALEVQTETDKKLSSLREMETKMTAKQAEKELFALHPDFAEIRADQEFHDWAEVQPQYIKDALYKNNTDVIAAARAIDLYKADKGIRTKKADPKDAARSVGRSTTAAPAPSAGKSYSESQVAAMSDAEYDKHEKAITEAMRTGKFEYDISGAAR